MKHSTQNLAHNEKVAEDAENKKKKLREENQALKTQLEEEAGEKAHEVDFLSSIELVVVDQALFRPRGCVQIISCGRVQRGDVRGRPEGGMCEGGHDSSRGGICK